MTKAPVAAAQVRFPWLVYGIIWTVIMLLTLLPLFSVLFTAGVAGANGCQVDEGSVHSCMVMGQDWGELLYFTGVMGWLMLVTFPLGGGAFIVWLIVLIIHRLAWRRAHRSPA
ncbi:MAG: hypothetical protein ACOH2N_17800 [Devosia sp.]